MADELAKTKSKQGDPQDARTVPRSGKQIRAVTIEEEKAVDRTLSSAGTVRDRQQAHNVVESMQSQQLFYKPEEKP